MSFRQAFRLVTKESINWFPGHMHKGMRQMQQKLKNIDCIIEVHDARIPISGRNLNFQHTITGNGFKPHILVLNKKDLADVMEQRSIINELRHGKHQHIIFTNCKQQTCAGVQRILPLATKLISDGERYNRASNKDFNIMIIGVPNVGKSSLINVLRNRHMKKKSAARVGALAGVTRSVGEKIKIQENPAIYMIDTPGITQPHIEDDETGMKLALVGCLPDHIVGEDLIADYLLYWLNNHQRFEYVKILGLAEPCDEIAKVLTTYAKEIQLYHRVKQYNGQVKIMADLHNAAKKFIQLFRTGKLGAINLDC